MLFTGKLLGVSEDWQTHKMRLQIEINEDLQSGIEDLAQCEKLSIELKKYREKRSLSANAYLWTLCEKIADKLQSSKEEIYRDVIRVVGVFSDFTGRKDAVENLANVWEKYGIGWFTDMVDTVNDYPTIRLYYGSSSYDSKQMSRLIDELVEQCKLIGVEHLPPDELKKMLAAWETDRK